MINKHTLGNGLRIVSEKIEYVKSVSIGIWVKVGSNNEDADTNGMSHFIEHMLFKGTENRKANEIAEEIDNMGGQINAFTGKECTCFYVKVLDENVVESVDVLSDMFFNSLFQQDDIDKEISVVTEEIKMYEDSPEDVVHDKITELVFRDSTLAYPILGTEKNLNTFNTAKVKHYKQENYTPGNTVIAIAGNFDEDSFLSLIDQKFGSWTGQSLDYVEKTAPYDASVMGVNKDWEQLHFCLGNRTIGRHDSMYYPVLILNNILGGTMSSRAFQEIREKRGLVYSIYSFVSNYAQTGIFGIYAGLSYDQLGPALSTLFEVMESMKEGDITEAEFKRAKQQIKGNYILGLESTSSRMSSIGRRELIYNEIIYPEEVIKNITAVKYNDVLKAARMLFDRNKFSVAFTGNMDACPNMDITIKEVLGA